MSFSALRGSCLALFFVGFAAIFPSLAIGAPTIRLPEGGDAAIPVATATPAPTAVPSPTPDPNACPGGTNQCTTRADGTQYCACCPADAPPSCGISGKGKKATETCECAACMVLVRHSESLDQSFNGRSVLSGPASSLSCLTNILKTQCAAGVHQDFNFNWDDDNCVQQFKFGNYVNANTTLFKNFSSQLPALKDKNSDEWNGYKELGMAFIDQNCNPVNTSVPRALCEEKVVDVQYLVDPIALFWTPDASLERRHSVSSFPLEPGQVAKWYRWYGSSDFPLVVYDPAHEGKITSAGQLFSQWTFGGKRAASLSNTLPTAWRDGYEALATLDADKNGRIDGTELDPIALWFDRNEDGISQASEVVRASAAGIEYLLFAPDRKDSSNGHLFASAGYAKRVDGRVVLGGSVDWVSPGYDTKLEARLASEPELVFSVSKPRAKAETASSDSSFGKTAPPQPGSGLWYWKADSFYGGQKPMGVLTLTISGDVLKGHSLLELPVKDTLREIHTVILSSPLQGKVIKGPNGETQMQFQVLGKDGRITETIAYLSNDGTVIHGKSVSQVGKGDRPSRWKRYEYSWTATRTEPGKE